MRIFHVAWPLMKHVENSLQGIRRAANRGYDAIDLDLLITRDNVIVCTHWDRPLRRDRFIDPLGRIRRMARVRELTWRQSWRLRAGGYRIRRVERVLRACANRGIVAYLEPKDDPRFTENWVWEHIAKVADDCGAHVLVRALPQNAAALPAAARAGFHTKVI